MNVFLNTLHEHDDAEWAPGGCFMWIFLASIIFWSLMAVSIYLTWWR